MKDTFMLVSKGSRSLAFVIIFLLCVVTARAQQREPEKTEVHGHTMYTLLKPGEIPAIFKPEFVSVTEASMRYYDNEPLLVVRDSSEVKGYSTWHLDRHEVVNDYINGKAITVTW